MWLSRHWLQIGLIMLFFGTIFGSGALMAISVFLLAAGFLAKFWSAHVYDNLRYERLSFRQRR